MKDYKVVLIVRGVDGLTEEDRRSHLEFALTQMIEHSPYVVEIKSVEEE